MNFIICKLYHNQVVLKNNYYGKPGRTRPKIFWIQQSLHSLSAYYVPGTSLNPAPSSSDPWQYRQVFYCLHRIDEDTEAQPDLITCPGLYSSPVTKRGFKPRKPSLKVARGYPLHARCSVCPDVGVKQKSSTPPRVLGQVQPSSNFVFPNSPLWLCNQYNRASVLVSHHWPNKSPFVFI